MRLQRQSNAEVVTIDTNASLGKGGEARVYGIVGEPGLAAKVYEADKDMSERIAKLNVMRALPPDLPSGKEGHVSIAWPLDLLCDETDATRVTGFLMGRVHDASQVIDVYNPQTRLRETPLFDYRYLLRTARNLSAAVRACHARGYVIGDLKHSNVLVTQTALVTLVDTDSFQVRDPQTGQIFACPVRTPDFTPPELQEEGEKRRKGEDEKRRNDERGMMSDEYNAESNSAFSTQHPSLSLSPSHDLFALAVLVFHLLMEGTHPFAGVYLEEGDPPPFEERIARGHFSYGRRDVPYRPNTRYAPPFDMLPPALRELFVRCFEEGHDNPEARPDARTWQRALDEAGRNLFRCDANPQHYYSNHLDACPWCIRRQAQLRGLDPFPSEQAIRERTKTQPPAPKNNNSAPHTDDWQQAPTAPNTPPSSSEIMRVLTYVGGLTLFFLFVVFAISSDKPHNQTVTTSYDPVAAAMESAANNYASVPESAPANPAPVPSAPAIPSGAITQVAYSPDGKTIAGVGKDILLWNAQSGKIKRKIPLNNLAVTDAHFSGAFAFAPDGKTLAASSGNTAVKLWDVATGKCRLTFSVQGLPHSFAYSHDGKMLAVSSRDWGIEYGGHTIVIFNAHTHAILCSLRARIRNVPMLCFSPCDDTLISAGLDSLVDRARDPEWAKRFCIEGWNAASGQSLFSQRNLGVVYTLACAPDGKTFLTHDYTNTAPYTLVRARDMRTGEVLANGGRQAGVVAQHAVNVAASIPANVTYAPSFAKAAYIYKDYITVYNAADWQRQCSLPAPAAPDAQPSTTSAAYTNFTSAAFSPGSDRVVTGSYTQGAQIWDAQTGKLLRSLERAKSTSKRTVK